jgi:S1-C subfamily serine protease
VFILGNNPGQRSAGLTAAARSIGGVVPGDVITALNVRLYRAPGDLQARLDDLQVRQSVEFTLSRGGVARKLRLQLDAAE